jgi:hypothetical protein
LRLLASGAIEARAPSVSSTMRRQNGSSAWPESVSAMRRVVRVSRLVPRRFSRLLTLRLIATLGTPKARAAAVKEPRSTTRANTAISDASHIFVS